MKCTRVREWLTAHESFRPAAVAEHLRSCEACRAYQARDTVVARLVGLKRYERPDPFLEQRLLARLHDGIASDARAPVDGIDFGPFHVPMPLLRYGVAAVFLAMMAFQFVRVTPGPSAAPVPLAQSSAPARARAPRPVAASWMTHPVWSPQVVLAPLPGEAAQTNFGPTRIEYGPSPSAVVDYNY